MSYGNLTTLWLQLALTMPASLIIFFFIKHSQISSRASRDTRLWSNQTKTRKIKGVEDETELGRVKLAQKRTLNFHFYFLFSSTVSVININLILIRKIHRKKRETKSEEGMKKTNTKIRYLSEKFPFDIGFLPFRGKAVYYN